MKESEMLKKKTDKLTKEMEEKNFEDEQEAEGTEKKLSASETLFEQVIALDKEAADWKDKYLRSMAEFENFRRRSNQEKADWIKLATQKMALDVCDVADNFERALLQLKDEDRENSFVKGVLMIEQQLRRVLDKEGVRKIDALGKEFDPIQHEAIAHIPSDYEENTVAAIIQNGYLMHEKLLRPARVAVSSGKQEEKKDESASGDAPGSGAKIINIEVQ
jgi:molecular chaperone GrpE